MIGGRLWQATRQLVEAHAIPIVASCMLLATVAVCDNAWARWLNYSERREMREESSTALGFELRETRKASIALYDRLGQLMERLDQEPRNVQ
jgi:hypothetical protein